MARLHHWKRATLPITASKGAPGEGNLGAFTWTFNQGVTGGLVAFTMDSPISLSLASTAGNDSTCDVYNHRYLHTKSTHKHRIYIIRSRYTRLHVTLIAWIAVPTPVRKVPGAESPDSRLSERPAVVAFELLEQVSGLLCLGEPGKVRAPLQHKIQQTVRGSRGIQCATKPKKQLGVVRCSQTGRAPAELADQSEALAATHARTAAALLTLRLGHHTPGRRRYRQRSGRGPPAPGLTPNLRCPCAAAVECTRWRREPRPLPAALEAWRQVPEARGSSSRPPSSRARRLVVAEWRSESLRQSTAE